MSVVAPARTMWPAESGAKADEDAASIPLPSDLHRQVAAALRRQPDIPWDVAVADIARKALP